MMQLALGPLMIDIAGTHLTDLDRERLCHPLVGGIILFTRNYANPEQLAELTREIHALRSPALLIAVDHEGAGCSGFVMVLPGCRQWLPWDAFGMNHRQLRLKRRAMSAMS